MNKRTVSVAAALVGVFAILTGISLASCCHAASSSPQAMTTTAPASQPADLKVSNTHCPIMGNPIDPDKVPERLTRIYKGQKIGFCCAMCPPKWDKLSDAEKDARLVNQGK